MTYTEGMHRAKDWGRVAVGLPGWRWMPGMLAHPPCPHQDEAWLLCWAEQVWDAAVQELTDAWLAGGYNANNGKVWAIGSSGSDPIDLAGWFPDLTDDATIGALLGLVRRLYRDPSKLWDGWVEVRRDHRSVFCVEQPFHDAAGALVWRCVSTGLNEAEALVAALEAAPEDKSSEIRMSPRALQ